MARTVAFTTFVLAWACGNALTYTDSATLTEDSNGIGDMLKKRLFRSVHQLMGALNKSKTEIAGEKLSKTPFADDLVAYTGSENITEAAETLKQILSDQDSLSIIKSVSGVVQDIFTGDEEIRNLVQKSWGEILKVQDKGTFTPMVAKFYDDLKELRLSTQESIDRSQRAIEELLPPSAAALISENSEDTPISEILIEDAAHIYPKVAEGLGLNCDGIKYQMGSHANFSLQYDKYLKKLSAAKRIVPGVVSLLVKKDAAQTPEDVTTLLKTFIEHIEGRLNSLKGTLNLLIRKLPEYYTKKWGCNEDSIRAR